MPPRTPDTGLRVYSPITWCMERFLWGLHAASPSRLFVGGRIAHLHSEAFRRDPHGSTRRRSRRIEWYITGWFALELVMLGVTAAGITRMVWWCRALAALRVLDIFQSMVNLSVFDQLRARGHLRISNAVRTLVLSFLNYVELLALFGILYATLLPQLHGATGWMDALYYSIVTQLTIGYGDIRPLGVARLITAAQGLIATAFTILIFGRIVSVLPRIESVMEHRDEDGATGGSTEGTTR